MFISCMFLFVKFHVEKEFYCRYALLILWDFNLYKDNPKKDIKEKREDSMTHIFRRQSRLSQCLCISLKVLDTLKNLTKDTHEVYSNINNLNLVMVFLDRHCYCTQCHTTRAPATPTGIYYMHHRTIDFFLSRCNARAASIARLLAHVSINSVDATYTWFIFHVNDFWLSAWSQIMQNLKTNL